ncbi:xylulokinase [Microbulbifer litoralis]|uniref:xylulokinase n=1 Tax=Microbulbifer litoralis TaxID=2933965 RepID=UPI0020290AD6|nr:xylulokinase [Microbulbifer sp. GX H0434]
MSVFLGIDAGTQSVKLLAFDADRGEVAHVSSTALELDSRADGSREQRAEWWLAALRQCMAKLPGDLRKRVAGIGVSGQQHGFVPLGDGGRVLAPVKLWCDTSTATECDEITARFGGEARCVDMVGNPILPGYTASKIAWLKKHNAEAYDALRHILLPHDYLNFYLTGEIFTECGDASGTGYLNIFRRRYDAGMLGAIDPDRDLSPLLPPILEAGDSVPLGEAARAEFDLPAGVRVSVGGGDNMMSALATGSVEPGVLTLSLGTSGTLFAHSDNAALDPGGELAAFCSSSGGWLPLLCTMNCTLSTDLTRGYLGRDLDACEQLLSESKPGADGLVTLPFFSGERAPNLPDARASLLGMNNDNTTPANLYRSAMEGASFALRRGLDAFARAGQRFSAVRLTGGGAASPGWRQMIADIFELPVQPLRNNQGAALGAALQSVWALQRHAGEDISLADTIARHLEIDGEACCNPDPDTAAEYREHYRHFIDTLQQLHPQVGEAVCTESDNR